MAEWIESHAALPRKTKFRRLARALGTTEVALVIGYLNALWYHAAECCPSGVLGGYGPEDVAEACYFQGDDPAGFTAALVKERWLDKCPEGYEIHDWQDYNRLHRERQKAAERQAAKRARERDSDVTSPDSHSDVTVTSRATDRQTGQTDRTDRQTGTGRPVDNFSIDGLVAMCRDEVGGWQSDEAKDLAIIRRCVARLGLERTQGLVIELATYQDEKPALKRYKNPRQALAQWCTKEKPLQQTRAPDTTLRSTIVEAIPLTSEERAAAQVAAKEARKQWEAMRSGIGKEM